MTSFKEIADNLDRARRILAAAANPRRNSMTPDPPKLSLRMSEQPVKFVPDDVCSDFTDALHEVAFRDVAGLAKARDSYGDSWKKRGGVGAFMMLARKWDRIEQALAPGDGSKDSPTDRAAGLARLGKSVPPWDVLAAMEADPRSEGIIDDVRDLRRYLLLVEAEIVSRGVNPAHRDDAE